MKQKSSCSFAYSQFTIFMIDMRKKNALSGCFYVEAKVGASVFDLKS